MLNLAGEQGQTLANEVGGRRRDGDQDTPAPPGRAGLRHRPAALTHDTHVIGNESLGKITLFTLAAIAIMLLVVYRSHLHRRPALPGSSRCCVPVVSSRYWPPMGCSG